MFNPKDSNNQNQSGNTNSQNKSRSNNNQNDTLNNEQIKPAGFSFVKKKQPTVAETIRDSEINKTANQIDNAQKFTSAKTSSTGFAFIKKTNSEVEISVDKSLLKLNKPLSNINSNKLDNEQNWNIINNQTYNTTKDYDKLNTFLDANQDILSTNFITSENTNATGKNYKDDNNLNVNHTTANDSETLSVINTSNDEANKVASKKAGFGFLVKKKVIHPVEEPVKISYESTLNDLNSSINSSKFNNDLINENISVNLNDEDNKSSSGKLNNSLSLNIRKNSITKEPNNVIINKLSQEPNKPIEAYNSSVIIIL